MPGKERASMAKVLYGCLLILLVVGPARSWADTDQHCLSQCVSGGGMAAASCLQQCTYNEKPDLKKATDPDSTTQLTDPSSMTLSTHKVFNAPTPLSTIILTPPAKTKSTKADKDYQCIAQCTHNGGQYQ